MDPTKLIEWLAGTPEPWQIFLAVLFLIFLLADKVGTLRSSWINLRLGRDELSLEKQRLEIEKLRYEIEAIRKAHGLPEIIPTPAPIVERRKTPTARELPPRQPLPPQAWLLNHPVAATLIFRIGKILMAFFGFISGLSGLAIPLLLIAQPSDIWPIMLVSAFIYLFLAYGCYRGYRRLQRSIAAIQMHRQTIETNAKP